VWEIIEQIRLKADLVVLSCCRAGWAKKSRERALIGLTRAFTYAGAQSVLGKPLGDPRCQHRRFMKAFYSALKAEQARTPLCIRRSVKWPSILNGTILSTGPPSSSMAIGVEIPRREGKPSLLGSVTNAECPLPLSRQGCLFPEEAFLLLVLPVERLFVGCFAASAVESLLAPGRKPLRRSIYPSLQPAVVWSTQTS